MTAAAGDRSLKRKSQSVTCKLTSPPAGPYA
jgi:hypothetical protein